LATHDDQHDQPLEHLVLVTSRGEVVRLRAARGDDDGPVWEVEIFAPADDAGGDPPPPIRPAWRPGEGVRVEDWLRGWYAMLN
jgi:hypothetical protein